MLQLLAIARRCITASLGIYKADGDAQQRQTGKSYSHLARFPQEVRTLHQCRFGMSYFSCIIDVV